MRRGVPVGLRGLLCCPMFLSSAPGSLPQTWVHQIMFLSGLDWGEVTVALEGRSYAPCRSVPCGSGTWPEGIEWEGRAVGGVRKNPSVLPLEGLSGIGGPSPASRPKGLPTHPCSALQLCSPDGTFHMVDILVCSHPDCQPTSFLPI